MVKQTPMNILEVSDNNACKLLSLGKTLKVNDADKLLGMALDALHEKEAKKHKEALNEQALKEWREQAHESMLFPTSFDESNVVFGPPADKTEEEVYSLSAALIDWDGEPAVLSCWKPSVAQLKTIAEKGRLWIATMGASMAPICVCSDNPIQMKHVTVKDES